jgi:hypothetical protein
LVGFFGPTSENIPIAHQKDGFKTIQMNTGKMKNPANHRISRVLVRLDRRFVGVAGFNKIA